MRNKELADGFFRQSFYTLVDSPNGAPLWWHSLPLPDGNRINGASPDKNLQLKLWSAMQIDTECGLSGKRVLDIGANDGFFTIAAAMADASHITAVDMDWSTWPTNIGYACDLWRVSPELATGDFLSLTFDDQYDVIFLLGVLYHQENLPACARRLRSLLTREGVVYVESQMTTIESPLPLFEYASDIYPTVAPQDKQNFNLVGISNFFFPNDQAVANLAQSYGFNCELIDGPENVYSMDYPYRHVFKWTVVE
jgi:tRNA (mo5U34)-methyltransferase